MRETLCKLSIILWMTLAHTFVSAGPRLLPIEMQRLCSRVDTDFSPAPEVLRAPSKDPLFSSIELGGGDEQVSKALGGRAPDSISSIGDITPLMYAAMTGNWQAALTLLKAGSNINFRSNYLNESILSASVFHSRFAFSCKLIEHGVELPRTRKEKNELMQQAISVNSAFGVDAAIFIDYLLSIGYDANDYGLNFDTPLISAVSLNNVPVIKLLLKHGTRTDAVKEGGRSVWGMAKKKNNPEVLKLLKEAEKKSKSKKRSPAALTPATV